MYLKIWQDLYIHVTVFIKGPGKVSWLKKQSKYEVWRKTNRLSNHKQTAHDVRGNLSMGRIFVMSQRVQIVLLTEL